MRACGAHFGAKVGARLRRAPTFAPSILPWRACGAPVSTFSCDFGVSAPAARFVPRISLAFCLDPSVVLRGVILFFACFSGAGQDYHDMFFFRGARRSYHDMFFFAYPRVFARNCHDMFFFAGSREIK